MKCAGIEMDIIVLVKVRGKAIERRGERKRKEERRENERKEEKRI